MSAPYTCEVCCEVDDACTCPRCECECDTRARHREAEEKAHAYWAGYFGISDGRSILQSGFTVWHEDGDAPGGFRPELLQ